MSQRIVIHPHYGGFKLTDLMKSELAIALPDVHPIDIEHGHYNRETRVMDWSWRAHPVVLAAVERDLAHAPHLKIIEVPAGVAWDVENYDGKEWVAEKHRTWSWPTRQVSNPAVAL